MVIQLIKLLPVLLIARGSDPNAAATDGVTPLALARIDPEMEELIRRHGGR